MNNFYITFIVCITKIYLKRKQLCRPPCIWKLFKVGRTATR